jgi:PAS domain S-box-containing protein
VHQIELEIQNEELRQAHQQVEQVRDGFARLYHHAPVGYLALNASGIIQQCNQTFAALIAHAGSELTGQPFSHLIPGPDHEVFLGRFKAFFKSPEGKILNVTLQRRDGGTFPAQLTGRVETGGLFPHQQPSAEPCLLVIVADISVQRRLEDERQQAHQRTYSILESIRDAFFSLDHQLAVTYFNSAAESALGRQREDVLDRPFFEAFPEMRGSAFDTQFSRALQEQAPLTFETHFAIAPYANWYEVRVHPFPRGISVFFNIVTERKCAELEKARLENLLQQAQKMESVGRLAGGVAHDFNNMLQAILGNVSLALEDTPADSPLRNCLHEIGHCAQRSADLTRQLLAFARRQIISPKVLDLNETVAGLLKMLERLIGEDIRLIWLPASNLAPVKVDPVQLHQILTNLCVNARDAIGGIGRITIATGNAVFNETYAASDPTFVPGEYVCLTVKDTGRGMDPETMAHIFEPFFTTKGIGEGTGLGLATVYGAVKQNFGFIQVQSKPTHGTTFKICLPRHGAPNPAAQTEPVAAPPRGRGETVLLVEDSQAILASTRKNLERLGYTVLGANSPAEAISLGGRHAAQLRLLITDVVMPEQNGRELAAYFQSLHPQLKCLFMSGYPANVIAHHGVLDEGRHFIQKPFTTSELAHKVRAILDQSD